jgi:EAL domain-containing protein (putative c-di-GMP-specific phosphodiesterase class I)
MYQAKAAGGDRVVGDDAQLRAEVGRRLQREAELRSAIEDGGLVVHYQGEWDLTTGELVGAEALARWEHPVEGLLAAGAFIPLAEECGLVEPLGERVLRLACAQVAAWKADGLAGEFLLRVNLSARQLRDHSTVELVAEVLEDTGLAARDLCLELTESAILVDPEGAVRTLQALRVLGVGLAVDDFGTGYSSMLYLKRLPITALKVDQAFVAGLPDDPGDVAIVQSTVQLADLLGLSLTAEGVETEAQRAALVRLGCRHAQGFGLARPEPAEVFVDRLH